MERERFQNYVANGEKATPTFSDAEMQRRLKAIRGHMANRNITGFPYGPGHLIVKR